MDVNITHSGQQQPSKPDIFDDPPPDKSKFENNL